MPKTSTKISTKSSTKTCPTSKRSRRRDQILILFKEVQSGSMCGYVMESSFQEYIRSIRAQACIISTGLKTGTNDRYTFCIGMPYKFFCAFLSIAKFGYSAFQFRSYKSHFTVSINISHIRDVELLLGNCFRRKELSNGYIDVLCSEEIPIVLKYNSRSEAAEFVFLTEVMEVIDGVNGSYLSYYKPGEHLSRLEAGKASLEKRKGRQADKKLVTALITIKEQEMSKLLLTPPPTVYPNAPIPIVYGPVQTPWYPIPPIPIVYGPVQTQWYPILPMSLYGP